MMSIQKKLDKMKRVLRHSKNKFDGVLKLTQFDRLLRKHVLEVQDAGLSLGKRPEAMIKSGLLSQILQTRSQRDFVGILESSIIWRTACGFNHDIPNQSTFSRHWNNSNYHDPLDKMFMTLIKLIGKRKIHLESEVSPDLLRILNKGYLPLVVDATFVPLSNKRFDFATRGYAGPESKSECGAKVNLIIDAILNMPFNYIPTEGNIHESKSIDVVIQDLLDNNHPWLRQLFDRRLRMLLIPDKGYWNRKRFMEWMTKEIGFITPIKKNNLIKCQQEFLEFPAQKGEPLEALVWIGEDNPSLRRIIAKNHGHKNKYWDLLSSIFDLTAKDIIESYIRRWPIEEIFKWLKQYTNLKRPLVESWDGFVMHCYFVLILLLLLQYFLALIGVPKWQDNLTELRRQLRNGVDDPWRFNRLRIPLAFFQGGMQ